MKQVKFCFKVVISKWTFVISAPVLFLGPAEAAMAILLPHAFLALAPLSSKSHG